MGTFPGELFHEIGMKIKASTHNRYSFLIGYCNGEVGYLPTQAAFSEGGYEPHSSPFAPVTEKIYMREVTNCWPSCTDYVGEVLKRGKGRKRGRDGLILLCTSYLESLAVRPKIQPVPFLPPSEMVESG